VVGIHHHATNPSPSILLHQAKKMIALEPIINASLRQPALLLYQQYRLTILNTLNHLMVILRTPGHISKIRTDLNHQDLIEMIVDISKTMEGEDHSN
jgi:hypothetical protein